LVVEAVVVALHQALKLVVAVGLAEAAQGGMVEQGLVVLAHQDKEIPED
jgi:hypothetical protein